MHVFISYSRRDRHDNSNRKIEGNTVDRILRLFKENGIDYWIDSRINPGEPFSRNIAEAIEKCDIFLFVSSAHSNASEWAHGEIASARQMNKRIIPVKIDDAPYHRTYMLYLAHLDFIDFTANYNEAATKLVNTIKDKRISVNLPEIVAFEKKGNDLTIGDMKLSDKIQQLFSAISVSDAIKYYLEIVADMKALTQSQSKEIEQIAAQLKHIGTLSNGELQKKKLAEISTLMFTNIGNQKRIDKMLLQLGLMVVYFYLNEAAGLQQIQKEIVDSRFDKTWWEENGGMIKAAGAFMAGIAAAMFGAPPSTVGVGAKSAGQVSEKHKDALKKSRQYFLALHDMISSVKFL